VGAVGGVALADGAAAAGRQRRRRRFFLDLFRCFLRAAASSVAWSLSLGELFAVAEVEAEVEAEFEFDSTPASTLSGGSLLMVGGRSVTGVIAEVAALVFLAAAAPAAFVAADLRSRR